jgi:hypothetical protein
MKKCIFLFIILLFSQVAKAQHIKYIYDGAGNRTIKYIELMVNMTSGMLSMPEDSLSQTMTNNDDTSFFSDENVAMDTTRQVLNVVAYPNPTNGYISLELLGLKDGESGYIVVVNKMGGVVYSLNRLSQVQTINIASAPPDIYFIRIATNLRSMPVVISIIKY